MTEGNKYWEDPERRRNFFSGQGFVEAQDRLVNGETELLKVADLGETGKGLVAKTKIEADKRVFGFHGKEVQAPESHESRYSTFEDGTNWWNLDGNPDHYLPNAICIGQDRVDRDDPLNTWVDPIPDSPLRYLNHSCRPNTTRLAGYTAWSLQDIKPGDQITMDYALLEINPEWRMKCKCGAPNCRGEIRSVQFLTPEQIQGYWKGLPGFMKRIYLESAQEKFTTKKDKTILKKLKEYPIFDL